MRVERDLAINNELKEIAKCRVRFACDYKTIIQYTRLTAESYNKICSNCGVHSHF